MESPVLHIDLAVPQGWHELSDKQLRYAFELIAKGFTSDDKQCKRVQSGACSGYAERSRNRCEANIGRDKVRQRCKWFSTKYYASVMNLKEFFADNLGRDFTGIIANALNDKTFRAQLMR